MADEKKTERRRMDGEPQANRPATKQSPAPERTFFDAWVDRRLKTMHDAVLDEKIPDDMLRMLLGDTAAEPTNSERGTSDDANRTEGQPDADVRPGRDRRH